MKTKITELLGIEYPIVQGAMAWIAEHHLAAAVSKAGGLGIIAGGAAPVDYIREEIHKAVSYTHLDVYKRQARCRPPAPRRCGSRADVLRASRRPVRRSV